MANATTRLTLGILATFPRGTILKDIRAYYVENGERIAWTRWPAATPAEIMEDIRLQRRFKPLLAWECMSVVTPTTTLGRPVEARRRMLDWGLALVS